MEKRFDFTRRNPSTSKVEKVGYLELHNQQNGTAELYFYGDIVSATWQSQWYEEDKCPQDISDFLRQITPGTDITVFFNSGGGDVFAGIAIYNLLRRHTGRKKGVVDALAASIASVILMACDEIIVKTGAQVMVHKPWCWACGNADELRRTIEMLDKSEASIIDTYMTKTLEGVTREAVAALVQDETWLTGHDMARYFDVTLESGAAIAACTSGYFDKYVRLPEHLKSSAPPVSGANPRVAEAESLLADLDDYGI